jgi:Fe-S cluster assembly iron-binding protein IscA
LGLALDEPKGAKTVTISSIEVLMDDEVKPFIEGQTLDYVTGHQGEGFIIAPESGASCC